MAKRKDALGLVGTFILGWLVWSMATKRAAAGIEIPLHTGINEGILYTGPRRSLPEAMTNVQDKIKIVWWYPWPTESPLFYDFTQPLGSTMWELLTGNEYIIVVTEDCVWKF